MRFVAAVAAIAILATGGVWWVSRDAGRPGAAGSLASAAEDPVTIDAIGDRVQTRRGGALPVFAAGGDTATLYRFAKDRADVLQWMPCTCGCAQLGHTSNRSCYVKSESGEATTWTSHAAT